MADSDDEIKARNEIEARKDIESRMEGDTDGDLYLFRAGTAPTSSSSDESMKGPELEQVPQLFRIDYTDRDGTNKTAFMALTADQHSLLLDNIGDALVRFSGAILHRVEGRKAIALDEELAQAVFLQKFGHK